MLTEKHLTDIACQYRVDLKRIGTQNRYILKGSCKRHSIQIILQPGVMHYGTHGVPGFNHPKTGRYIPPVFFADGSYGLEFKDIGEPMAAAAAGNPAPLPPGVPVIITDKERAMVVRTTIYRKQGKRCYYCKKRVGPKDITCDHIVAVANGGTDEPGNWVMACYRCNSRKKDMSAEAFLIYLKTV